MAIGVGIDIAKDKFDVATSDGTVLGSFANSAAGLGCLLKRLAALEVDRIVLEATGGYEQLALARLHAARFVVVLIQPARARHFAKALGRYAKTDEIDALMLARMAVCAVEDVTPWEPLDEHVAELRALNERRVQLVALIDAENKRLRGATKSVAASIGKMLRNVRKLLADVERQIDAVVQGQAEICARVAALENVRGVGRVTAVSLLSWMPELGRINRREVAALVGVAPINRDSGTWSGQRFTFGGRVQVRNALYMATLVATRWNEHIKAHYVALVQRGKPKKVALVACMRKLLIHLNALLRDASTPTHAALTAS